jgi:hypothetical protein
MVAIENGCPAQLNGRRYLGISEKTSILVRREVENAARRCPANDQLNLTKR